MRNYFDQNTQLKHYPGGTKAFENTPLSSRARDQLHWYAEKHNDDAVLRIFLNATAPFYKLTEESRSTEVGNMRFGMSQRPRYVDKEKDSFCVGACAHCVNSPVAPPGVAKHLQCIYQTTDPLDSAHDWSDCPRVKHALFVWGETSAKQQDPKFKDGALIKRLQLWPNDPVSKVTTLFDCEENAGFTVWASNSGAVQVGNTPGQLKGLPR